jgi:hypothetical protein
MPGSRTPCSLRRDGSEPTTTSRMVSRTACCYWHEGRASGGVCRGRWPEPLLSLTGGLAGLSPGFQLSYPGVLAELGVLTRDVGRGVRQHHLTDLVREATTRTSSSPTLMLPLPHATDSGSPVRRSRTAGRSATRRRCSTSPGRRNRVASSRSLAPPRTTPPRPAGPAPDGPRSSAVSPPPSRCLWHGASCADRQQSP